MGISAGLGADSRILENLCRLSGFRRFATGRQQEPAFKICNRHWAAEEVALPFLASQAQQEIGGRAILDPLRDHRQAELLAEADRRTDDRRIIGVEQQVTDEGAVDLETVERELLHIAEARVTGA